MPVCPCRAHSREDKDIWSSTQTPLGPAGSSHHLGFEATPLNRVLFPYYSFEGSSGTMLLFMTQLDDGFDINTPALDTPGHPKEATM